VEVEAAEWRGLCVCTRTACLKKEVAGTLPRPGYKSKWLKWRGGGQSQIFFGRTIDVPSCFIAGKSDRGIRQRRSGDMIKMQQDVLMNMLSCNLADGAGH
jgi:hypothetical protein